MKSILLVGLILFSFLSTYAQQLHTERLDSKKKIVCYAKEVSYGTRIYPKNLVKKTSARTQSVDIQVTYHGFTPEAQAAFQRAIDIWKTELTSPVTIHVDATWQGLDPGVLGSAIWGSAFRNFEGAKEINTWYPVALAEKMAGKDLNDPSEPDIVANFSSAANWYLGTDGNPGASEYDLVSVVLHELGHGLGFIDNFGYDDSQTPAIGTVGTFPFVFDLSVINDQDQYLASDFGTSSEELGNQLVSNKIYFNSPTAIKVTGSTPRLYAPTEWSAGSSIAHLNELTYFAGNINSLMTPQIGMNEVMQDPGPVTLNMFGDMGWEYTYINHNRLLNTEDYISTSFNVIATINSDITYKTDSVRLFYSLDGFKTDVTEVFMTPTGNPDEYAADILTTATKGQSYSYYITVVDINSRDFYKPSLAPEVFYTFTTDDDTQAPEITHNKPGFIRNTDTEIILEATIKDFSPIATTEVEYYINDQPAQTTPLALINESDSIYQASIDLTGASLQEGDSIKYKILATDQSSNSNSSTYPASGFIKLDVLALAPAVVKYNNDFNNMSTASLDFFTSNNFRIETPTGFANGAIHSDHPYANGTGTNDESNYTYELRIPITLQEGESTIAFDEIVLVEPGELGTQFGSSQFWDYVIVEGSNDGGVTWKPLDDGYDSRANDTWLSVYNSDIIDNLSQGTGDDSMFINRVIDIKAKSGFTAGEEILIRFRLFADQAAHGWGWAIDNLKIQIDETPPVIKHDHFDYVTDNSNILIETNITDNIGVDSVAIVDGNNNLLAFFPPNQAGDYSLNLGIGALQEGDTIQYQIQAYDISDPINISYLPAKGKYFEVPFISFNNPVNKYSNDFNTSNNDFVGNFFETSTMPGFSDGAIHTSHPYPSGFGLNGPSNFTFTLKTPIIVDEQQHYLAFDHVFLGAANSDKVIVEAAKTSSIQDWQLIEEFYVSDNEKWLLAQNNDQQGESSLYKYDIVNLLANSNLSTGDEVIIRFRLNSQVNTSGWGWAIDNLEIQTDNITGLPDNIAGMEIQLFPNPVEVTDLNVRLNATKTIKDGTITIINSNAQVVRSIQLSNISGKQETQIEMASLPKGLYLVKINLDGQSISRKIVKI